MLRAASGKSERGTHRRCGKVGRSVRPVQNDGDLRNPLPSCRDLSQTDDPLGIRIGQRPPEETVYETEGRGVRADADGENDQRGEGERGPRGELPQRLAHIEAKPSHVQHRTKQPARKPPVRS